MSLRYFRNKTYIKHVLMLKYLLFSLVTPKCQPTRITSRGRRCVSAPNDASKVTGPVFLKGTEHATMATEEGQGAKHLSNKGVTGLSVTNEHIESKPVIIANQAKMYANMHAIHQSKKNDVELHEYATAIEKSNQSNDGLSAPSLTHEYMECLTDEPGNVWIRKHRNYATQRFDDPFHHEWDKLP